MFNSLVVSFLGSSGYRFARHARPFPQKHSVEWFGRVESSDVQAMTTAHIVLASSFHYCRCFPLCFHEPIQMSFRYPVWPARCVCKHQGLTEEDRSLAFSHLFEARGWSGSCQLKSLPLFLRVAKLCNRT